MENRDAKVQAAKVLLGAQYEKQLDVQSEMVPEIKGSVTVALPTGKDLARMAVLQHDLREGRPLEELDALSAGMIIAISTVAVVVRRAPDWFYRIEGEGTKDAKRVAAPEMIVDQKIIWDIFGGYVAFRDSFPGRGAADGGRATPEGAGALPSGEAVGAAAV